MKGCLDIIREVQSQYGEQGRELRAAGGGMKFPLWRQIFADILETRIGVTEHEEVGSLGAAMLAGVGGGVYASIAEAVTRCQRSQDPVVPNAKHLQVYRKYYGAWNELYERIEPLFEGLN